MQTAVQRLLEMCAFISGQAMITHCHNSEMTSMYCESYKERSLLTRVFLLNPHPGILNKMRIYAREIWPVLPKESVTLKQQP